jgi:hypothetical protein
MVATVNVPGSKHFTHAHGTRAQCRRWLEEQQHDCQRRAPGNWAALYLPAQLLSERTFATWRWRNGRRICPDPATCDRRA